MLREVSESHFGDYQFEIYFNGLSGQLPKYPVDFAALERKAAEVDLVVRGRWLWR
jgi:hypothetical protein